MPTLIFFVNLAGATMLLLFAVRMVRVSIERLMGPSFQRIVTERQNSRLQASFAGAILAVILQSATATALLASSFAATGLLSFSGGLAVVLGADLGSALVIQILSFKLDWLIPLLLATGGWLYLRRDMRVHRLTGRILMAIAFTLLALRLLGEATEPIREGSFLPVIANYLQSDYITAFIVGAAVTFVMHSSVAAILMCVTFVSLGVLPVSVGVSLLLGANLGAALLPVWLSRGMEPKARRIPFANLLLRGLAAVFAVLLFNLTPLMPDLTVYKSGQVLVTIHLIFNAAVLVCSLPFLGLLEAPVKAQFPEPTRENPKSNLSQPASVLDPSVNDNPTLALSVVTREVLRMGQIVEVMFRPVMTLYESGNKAEIKAIQALDDQVNTASTEIRRYVASIPQNAMNKAESRQGRALVEYAINLETAGDIIARKLLPLANEKTQMNVSFSKPGWNELTGMYDRVIANITMAFNVLLSDDIESARLLLEEKAEMAHLERKSRKKHLKRLRDGTEASFESSDIHLETLRGLKDVNSQICAVAYPILHRHGQLLETRLIEAVDTEHTEDPGDEAA